MYTGVQQEISRISHQPNSRAENIGSTKLLVDGNDHVRNLEYGQGDVKFRKLDIAANGDVLSMTAKSGKHGLQIWKRAPDGTYYDEVEQRKTGNAVHHRFDMAFNQQTGEFSFRDKERNQSWTYTAEGRRIDGQFAGRGDSTKRQDLAKQPRDPAFQSDLAETFTDAQKRYHEITDQKSYQRNLDTAAAEKKPAVIVFGRGTDKDTPQVLDAMRQVKSATNGQAECMFIDIDKVDPNSAIGKFAQGHIAQKFNGLATMVVTQDQANPGGAITQDKPMYVQGGQVNVQQLMAAVNDATRIQQSRDVQIGGRPMTADNRSAQPAVIADGRSAQPAVIADGRSAQPAAPSVERLLQEMHQHPWDPKGLNQVLSGMKIEDRFATLEKVISATDQLQERARNLDVNDPNRKKIEQLAGLAQSSFGMMCVELGNQYEAASRSTTDQAQSAALHDLAQRTYVSGAKWLASAGIADQQLFSQPAFCQAVLKSGLPENVGNLLITEARTNNQWLRPTQEEMRLSPRPFDAATQRVTGQILSALRGGPGVVVPDGRRMVGPRGPLIQS